MKIKSEMSLYAMPVIHHIRVEYAGLALLG